MITKAKVDRIVAALEKKAAAHERESNVADTPEMQGCHMGAQDACELAVGMLEGLSSTGDGSVRFCKWCGKKFPKQKGRAYCCDRCSGEAAEYWRYRGGKGLAGDAADGIPVWDDFRQFAVDMAAEEDLMQLPNGRRLAQLREKMAPILEMIATSEGADKKSDMSPHLRLFLQAYARFPEEYWRANPSKMIFF